MNILLAGASGFIGRELIAAFAGTHQLTVLGRDRNALLGLFPPPIHCLDWSMLDAMDAHSFDVVINLCGKNIAQSRWNKAVKQELIDSRVKPNQQLIQWLLRQQAKPAYYCASAIGIYGLQSFTDDRAFDEHSSIDDEHPHDFLSEIGIRWEQSLQPAIDAGIPVTITRFGVVLKPDEGMLKKLIPVFKLGAGSILGSGQQILSWVSSIDVVNAYQFLLANPDITGPINITGPHPVSQREFAQTLANILHRPLWLKTPPFVIRLLFGEMGDCLLLQGQRVLPLRLHELGFQFQYAELESALDPISSLP